MNLPALITPMMNKQMMHSIAKVIIRCSVASVMSLLMGGAALSAYSDTIEVPIGQQAPDKWTMDRPVTGMSKDQVKSFFGDPIETKAAVGDPPISRWIYEDFVVYFEYDHVIHSVLKNSGDTQQQAQVQKSQ